MSWRVSSYSGQAAACVEVRNDLGALRDSKDPSGRTLQVAGLADLVRTVRALPLP